IRKIVINKKSGKSGDYYQAEKYTEKQVFHENIDGNGLEAYVAALIPAEFKQADAFSEGRCRTLRISKKGKESLSESKNEQAKKAESHNRQKNYLLPEGTVIPPLVDLGVFTPEGKVAAKMQDKYRQINRFIEMVDDAVRQHGRKDITIIDFGCGKSYLTFILYYYLTEVRGLTPTVIGLDLKADVIASCNLTAFKYGYTGLRFELGDIAGYTPEKTPDMVISLHACDTATDHALYNAVKWGTKMIFSVPCCQHELNSQIESDRFAALTRYGIIKERTAALMTDAIRGCLLESVGYKTALLEFVDMAHSPKNILIRAYKANTPEDKRKAALQEAINLMEDFHLSPTLYKLLHWKKIGMK
ncbi:MAG: SAM-dependent methyltransferase, partial [Clostridia bacterium]|nr:SAM-dependent methyltransferase [Clostridia bacterium]